MKPSRLHSSFLLAATFAFVLLVTAIAAPRARAADDVSTTRIKFSDAAKPGTLKVSLKMGDVTITGTDDPEVTVETELESQDAPVRKDGLRVISESATFSLKEQDNVVTLDTGDYWGGFGNDAEFNIRVPRNTNVIVSNGFGGEISIEDIDGDIDVKSLNGEISLDNISGSALVETMNGEISATIRQLSADKPLSFTSMNGEIDIHLPADAQAKIRLRTQNGAILTDFDEKALATKTEAVSGSRNRDGRFTVNVDVDSEIKTAMREAVRAGVVAAREVAEAMREAAAAAREAAAEVRAESQSNANGIPPVPPIPPVSPVPPMTGGKLVSGLLNGGEGPEIYAAAMNGDVTLRKVK
jgi:hypothetical protein